MFNHGLQCSLAEVLNRISRALNVTEPHCPGNTIKVKRDCNCFFRISKPVNGFPNQTKALTSAFSLTSSQLLYGQDIEIAVFRNLLT